MRISLPWNRHQYTPAEQNLSSVESYTSLTYKPTFTKTFLLVKREKPQPTQHEEKIWVRGILSVLKLDDTVHGVGLADMMCEGQNEPTWTQHDEASPNITEISTLGGMLIWSVQHSLCHVQQCVCSSPTVYCLCSFLSSCEEIYCYQVTGDSAYR